MVTRVLLYQVHTQEHKSKDMQQVQQHVIIITMLQVHQVDLVVVDSPEVTMMAELTLRKHLLMGTVTTPPAISPPPISDVQTVTIQDTRLAIGQNGRRQTTVEILVYTFLLNLL